MVLRINFSLNSQLPQEWSVGSEIASICYAFFSGVPTCRRISRWYWRSTGVYNTRHDIFHTLGRGQLRPPPRPLKPTFAHAWYSMGTSRSELFEVLSKGWSLCPREGQSHVERALFALVLFYWLGLHISEVPA